MGWVADTNNLYPARWGWINTSWEMSLPSNIDYFLQFFSFFLWILLLFPPYLLFCTPLAKVHHSFSQLFFADAAIVVIVKDSERCSDIIHLIAAILENLRAYIQEVSAVHGAIPFTVSLELQNISLLQIWT